MDVPGRRCTTLDALNGGSGANIAAWPCAVHEGRRGRPCHRNIVVTVDNSFRARPVRQHERRGDVRAGREPPHGVSQRRRPRRSNQPERPVHRCPGTGTCRSARPFSGASLAAGGASPMERLTTTWSRPRIPRVKRRRPNQVSKTATGGNQTVSLLWAPSPAAHRLQGLPGHVGRRRRPPDGDPRHCHQLQRLRRRRRHSCV